jgi:hypothetical protein
MLAGELYFYNTNEEVIEEMDVVDYEKMRKVEFLELIEKLDCFKVTLHSIYHNHQLKPHIQVIYEQGKDIELPWHLRLS